MKYTRHKAYCNFSEKITFNYELLIIWNTVAISWIEEEFLKCATCRIEVEDSKVHEVPSMKWQLWRGKQDYWLKVKEM